MTIKVTLRFSAISGKAPAALGAPGVRIHGWTESLYFQGNDVEAAKAKAFPPNPNEFADTLANKRSTLLPERARIVAGELRVVGAPAPPVVVPLNLYGLRPQPNDLPQFSLLVRLSASNLRRANFFLRGIPDGVIVNGEYVGGDANWTANMAAYLAFLTNYQIHSRVSSTAVNEVVSVTQDAAPSTGGQLVYRGTVNFVTGDLIRVRRSLDSCRRRRGALLRIALIAPTTKTITFEEGWKWGNTTGGTVGPDEDDFFNITAAVIQRAVLKKVGRPAELFRGRRPARR